MLTNIFHSFYDVFQGQHYYLIQDLITWKDYVLQVASYNNKGVGVYSDSIRIKTKEGGLLFNL